MKYQVPAAPAEPKPDMTDCTDRPEIIAACEAGAFGAPRGGWFGGRFLVYRNSLREWRGEAVEYKV